MSSMKVGVLQDFLMPQASQQVMLDALRLAFDESYADGEIDRPVELVLRAVDGLPRGTSFDVLNAWKELEAEGVLVIFGPWASDNVLAIRTYVEDVGHIPTLSMSGTDRWYGEWCFCINNGSLPEEPYLLSNYLGVRGVESVAVVYDKCVPGEEYTRFFRDACAFDGVKIAIEEPINMLDTDLSPALARLRASGADAIAYLGWGLTATHLNTALDGAGWDPVKVMSSGFMAAPFLPGGLKSIAGWVGVDQYDEDNVVGQDFLDRFEARFGYRPANFFSVLCYDFGVVIARGLSKATPLSPDGVKEGLEKVKMVPAATGGPGGVFSFGPHARRAWLTPHFIVLREPDPAAEVADLTSGPGSVLRHRYTARSRSERLGTAQRTQ